MPDYQGEKFEQYLDRKGVSVVQAAEILGVVKQTVYQYFKSKSLSRETVSNILTKFGASEEEIFGGEPKIRIEAEPAHLSENPDLMMGRDRFIELPDGMISMRIPEVPVKAYAAGYLIGYTDPHYFDDFEMTTIEVTKRHTGHYLAFEVKGDSMTTLEPEHFRESIFDGVKVVGRELPRQQWRYRLHTHRWDSWVIVHREKGVIIKNIIDQDVTNGTIRIHSLNPDKKRYPDETLNLDDIEQIFNVVKKIDE